MTPAQSSPIRVGLIRCDTHGAYYGALMAVHDPLCLQSPLAAGATGHYSWQSGGAHFYFYTNYSDPSQMTVEAVDGFHLARVWDEHEDAAQCLAAVFDDHPIVCSSVDEVSDDVDLVFIADCNGDGSDHLQLARPGLEKGVATFVDKPLAFTTGEARTIVALAADHGAPFASASILQALPGAAQFSNRLAEVGELQFGTIQGGGLTLAGQIHTIGLALRIFGDGVVGVRAMGDGEEPETIHLDYGSQPGRPVRGVTLSCNVGADPNERRGYLMWHTVRYDEGEIAKLLLSHNARLDLRTAAVRGPISTMSGFFNQDGTLRPTAHRGYRQYFPTRAFIQATPEETLTEALTLAARADSADKLEFLLDHGADIHSLSVKFNWPDDKGEPPLHHAAGNSHVEAVRLLLARGADPIRPNHWGGTPLNYAHWADDDVDGKQEIIRLLEEAASEAESAEQSSQ